MIESATGLILRTRPLTETSLIVNWLTREHGRFSTVAKGARRPKSPFAGKLDLFYRAEFTFTRSRSSDLHTLREVELKETHAWLRTEMDRLQCVAYCTALVTQATEPDTPLPAVFELMAGLLAYLADHPPSPQIIFAFELKLLHELGLSPDLEDSKLTLGARRLAATLTAGDWSSCARLRLSEAQVAELRQFLHGFLIYHLGRIPKGRETATDVAVGRLPSAGVTTTSNPADPPRRLRRLHRVWPDRYGNISYLLTICVDGRGHVLDNEPTFSRLVAFLLDSPSRYHWFGRRFVIMPDHVHLIARMGQDSVAIGQWVKALKVVLGGLERRNDSKLNPAITDKVAPVPHEYTRVRREWQWQEGFHDHKFRNPESEQRKWEYVCLNPVRAGLVKRPEEWSFGGEILYESTGPRLIRGTPPLLEIGLLMQETPEADRTAPGEGTRPTR